MRDKYPGFKNVFVFKPGMAFGEIALQMKSSSTATMVCKEATHVMTLSKQTFDLISGTYSE